LSKTIHFQRLKIASSKPFTNDRYGDELDFA